MNERIKHLTQEAHDWAEVAYKNQNDKFASHWDTPIGYTLSQFFEQKFAELIVKDCIQILVDRKYDNPYDSATMLVNQGLQTGVEVISEKFGVQQ